MEARQASSPVLACCAGAVRATARGVFSYLTKPFDGKALLDKVNEALALTAPAQQASTGDEAWRASIVSRSNLSLIHI